MTWYTPPFYGTFAIWPPIPTPADHFARWLPKSPYSGNFAILTTYLFLFFFLLLFISFHWAQETWLFYRYMYPHFFISREAREIVRINRVRPILLIIREDSQKIPPILDISGEWLKHPFHNFLGKIIPGQTATTIPLSRENWNMHAAPFYVGRAGHNSKAIVNWLLVQLYSHCS